MEHPDYPGETPRRSIGPPERPLQLIRDLTGQKRLWLAQDTENVLRVVKIFLPNMAAGSSSSREEERAARADEIGFRAYLTRVRARVELAASLQHPVIARVYGWRQGGDGIPFAEMEYFGPEHGQTLEQLLHERGTLPWDLISRWLTQIADALDYAHQKHRCAHHHLDADTVFITDQGTVKLLSFGLAKEIQEPRSVLFSPATIHREGAVDKGSSEMAPDEVLFRRDVFALACLVYRSLSGRTVYEAQGEPSAPIPRPPGLTDEAWQVMRRGLAYPSELCPVSAREFVRLLEAAQQAVLPPPGPARKRQGWVWGLAAAGVLAIGGGGYWWSVSQSPASNPAIPVAEPPQNPTSSPTPVSGGREVIEQAAEREADERAFAAARRVNTVSAYQLYLQRCPQCGYAKEAQAAIRQLELNTQIETIKADFAALVAAFDAGTEGRGDEALERLKSLAELAPEDPLIASGRERLARVWIRMAVARLNQADVEGANKWLKKAETASSTLPELTALRQAIVQTEAVARMRQTDTEAFAAARRIDTRRAYWDYLDRCKPNCKHRAEAEAAISRLSPTNPILRDRLRDGSQGPEMVVVPAGEFRMGSPPSEIGRYSDESLRVVRIEKPFAIGRYEVAFHEYERFAAATNRPLPDDHGWGRNRRPVVGVDWKSAMAYAAWLSEQTGQRYRLPTEAEWEYAARAGTGTSRYWGDNPDEGCAYANAADLDGKKAFVGWTVMQCHDGYIYTAPVGSYRSNDFGLYDMAGNVLEWTCSIYDKEGTAPIQQCQEPGPDQEMVVRGGSWSDEPRNVRSADRHRSRPESQDYFLGFRLVREQP